MGTNALLGSQFSVFGFQFFVFAFRFVRAAGFACGRAFVVI